MKTGFWPQTEPEGILPILSGKSQKPETGRTELLRIWRKAIAGVTDETKERADKKIDKQRQRHQREQVSTGELIVTTPGHFIGRRGDRIVVRKQQTVISEILGIRLRNLTIASHGVAISSDVIHYCSSRDIFVNFIDGHGHILAVTHKPDGVRAELAFLQAVERDGDKGVHLARIFVTGKMKNQFALLKSYAKYGRHRASGFGKLLQEETDAMQMLMTQARRLKTNGDAAAFRQQLMGLEGAFGAKYWKLVRALLPEQVDFLGREHQGATDLVNSLLNYGYGILYNQTLNSIAKAGLNAQAGFLHSYQPGKPVLVFDLVEEFRAPVVDRPVVSMLNRREPLRLNQEGLLQEETRKKVAAGVLSRLGNEVVHCGRRQTLQDVVDFQAMAVRRYLLGQERYRPYHSKW